MAPLRVGIVFIIALLFAAPFLLSLAEKDGENATCSAGRNYVLSHLDTIYSYLDSSASVLKNNNEIPQKQLIKYYHTARKSYKRISYFIEYYSPAIAKYYINGALVPKFDNEYGNHIIPPHGFQVIEQQLFTKGSQPDKQQLIAEYALLQDQFKVLRTYYSTLRLHEAKLYEIQQLQLVQAMCLNLSGYDCTINHEQIKETAYMLLGIAEVIAYYKHFATTPALLNQYYSLQATLHKAANMALSCIDPDKFDKLGFIVQYLNKAYGQLSALHQSAEIPYSGMRYSVNLRATSFFDDNSFDKQTFSLYEDDTAHVPQQAALGRLLFFDPILSGNHERACASCHQPQHGLSNGMNRALTYDKQNELLRNVPGLLNVRYQRHFLADGSGTNIEEQAFIVIHNKQEMNSNADSVVHMLQQSNEYVQLFRGAYMGTADTAITFYAVMKAIAEYERSFESRNSRLDKYLRGNNSALTLSEVKGYNLFAGKALCGSCHFFPLFSGLTPPLFADHEYEVIGTLKSPAVMEVDADTGRIKVTHGAIHRYAFKTPTVRNIALTAPYMHNGQYNTLDEVLDFYKKGGGAGMGVSLQYATLPFDSLQLSPNDIKAIKAFLLALTDSSHMPKAPDRLPQFADKQLNKRKIGGVY